MHQQLVSAVHLNSFPQFSQIIAITDTLGIVYLGIDSVKLEAILGGPAIDAHNPP